MTAIKKGWMSEPTAKCDTARLVSKIFATECKKKMSPKLLVAELHTHRKVKETHELIFSWLSWLAVLLAGAYDDDGDDGGVAQDGGHFDRDMQLGLPFTFLINGIILCVKSCYTITKSMRAL